MKGNIIAFWVVGVIHLLMEFSLLATAYRIFDNVNAIKLQFIVLTGRAGCLAHPARFTEVKLALATCKWSCLKTEKEHFL